VSAAARFYLAGPRAYDFLPLPLTKTMKKRDDIAQLAEWHVSVVVPAPEPAR
jgi:hypothetical protein